MIISFHSFIITPFNQQSDIGKRVTVSKMKKVAWKLRLYYFLKYKNFLFVLYCHFSGSRKSSRLAICAKSCITNVSLLNSCISLNPQPKRVDNNVGQNITHAVKLQPFFVFKCKKHN